MAKCPYCKKVTLLSEEEFEKSSFQCSHCKKIAANKPPENAVSPDKGKQKEEPEEVEEDEEEIYDEVEDEEDEETLEEEAGQQSIQKLLLGGGLVLLLGLGLFFSQKPKEEVPVLPQVETVVPTIPEVETPFVLQALSRILPEEAVFGDTVTQITQANSDLFAMNSQGNHWGNFETGLTLPLEKPVPVGTIFYFFDAALTLQNLEFQLRPQEEQFSPEEVVQITTSLSLWYELVEQGEQWYLWKATDGFLAFSTQHQFLYVSDEEEKVRSVLY